ncbi:MAG: hypothetical protein KDD62_07550, partial [Bdellovibrionales bacterium]|nr:hypothetical protein [Bdellovibrionales bacterium]
MSTEIFDSLSDSERSGLIVLPAAIFILIAGADGNVDDKEVATFNRLLSSVDDSDQDLTSICVRRLRASSSGLVATLATMMEQGSSESSARLAAQIAWQKFPNQVVTDYFEDLLELAKQIAAASGGLFGGSISKEEKQALAAIRKLLFIDARVAAQTPQHGPQATESQPTYDYDSVKERFAVRVYADEHP